MSQRTILIVGGALSGPTAAARAREVDEDARIVLIERNRDVSYAVAGLASFIAGEVSSLDALNRERAEFFRDVYRVEVQTRKSVLGIDPARKRVRMRGEELRYDALVFAAGAGSLTVAPPGFEAAKNVFSFRTLVDLEGITKRLDAGARQVTVLGGGFFGLEAAEAFLRRGLAVTLVERGARLLPQFSREMSERALQALRALGATVHTDAEVRRAYRKGALVSTLGLSNRQRVKTDLVVVAVGVEPRTTLLRRAGAKLHSDGSVVVDARCATSLPGVFACGVCVALPHVVTGKPVWQPQASVADKTAQVAGAAAAGGRARMGPITGTQIVRIGEFALARTGLGEAEARAHAGTAFDAVRVSAPARDGFLSAPLLHTLLYYDRKTGGLLGAEVAGATGVDKRIDVFATALLGRLTVAQLAGLDLAYAPAFAPARDPINIAGLIAHAGKLGLAKGYTPQELERLGERVVLVDVRAAAEFALGTLPGALNLPLARLRERRSRLNPRLLTVFISSGGREGYLAARIAKQRGVSRVGYLAGGLEAWLAEGRSVERVTRGPKS